jgi:hypothetical protein
MAGIIYNSGNVSLNPTDGHLPVRIGNQFVDSSFTQEGDFQNASVVNTVDNVGNPYGFKMNPASGDVFIGDFDALTNATFMALDNTNGIINFNSNLAISFLCPDPSSVFTINANSVVIGTNLLRINGSVTAGAAGAASGQFLMININGTAYKINLLLP